MGVLLCNCNTASRVPYLKHYLVRDTINSLVWSKGYLPHTNDLTRQPAVGDRQTKIKNGTQIVY